MDLHGQHLEISKCIPFRIPPGEAGVVIGWRTSWRKGDKDHWNRDKWCMLRIGDRKGLTRAGGLGPAVDTNELGAKRSGARITANAQLESSRHFFVSSFFCRHSRKNPKNEENVLALNENILLWLQRRLPLTIEGKERPRTIGGDDYEHSTQTWICVLF